MSTDFFCGLKSPADDPIIALNEAFAADPREHKVNLTIGNYLGADGKIPLQPTVEEAQRRLLERKTVHSYLSMTGLDSYCRAIETLSFGENATIVESGRLATVQAVGGTGALFLGGMFAHETLGIKSAAVPDPTWGNHIALFKKAGLCVSSYDYYDRSCGRVDFEAMMASIRALRQPSLVLLQVSCHNPTGMDLTEAQWKTVVETIGACGHLAFLDMAYQGFARGLVEDALPVRLFAESGQNFLLSVSLSKGFSLYGERVGSLTVAARSADEARVIKSLLKAHIRALYSNPPRWGAMIVAEILHDSELRARWVREVDAMRERVRAMRRGLAAEGEKLGVTFDFALAQNGIFSFTGFSALQMQRLRRDFGVYGIDSGRIAMAGLTEPVLPYVAQAFAAVIKDV